MSVHVVIVAKTEACRKLFKIVSTSFDQFEPGIGGAMGRR